MKKRKSCFIWLLCILLLVTALPAVDFTDVQAASVSSTFTGWKTYGGKKYYYKNGKKLTDLHKIGKYYYCFAADCDINYIRADHDNISMSEVQHFSDSVYHGITKSDDRIYTSEADTTDKI